MAMICPRKSGCTGCPHLRLDPDRQYAENPRDRYSCYLKEDLEKKGGVKNER